MGQWCGRQGAPPTPGVGPNSKRGSAPCATPSQGCAGTSWLGLLPKARQDNQPSGHSKATATVPAPGGTVSRRGVVPLCPEATFSGPWGFRPPHAAASGGSSRAGSRWGAGPCGGLQSALRLPGPSCRAGSEPEPGGGLCLRETRPRVPLDPACLSMKWPCHPGQRSCRDRAPASVSRCPSGPGQPLLLVHPSGAEPCPPLG